MSGSKIATPAGCSLMREPAQAAAIVSAMTGPFDSVMVKMRGKRLERNAPLLRMDEDAGAAAVVTVERRKPPDG